MTFKKFKEKNGGGYVLKAAEDIPGFYRKGDSMYGNCDDLEVVNWLYQPLNGIFTVFLANKQN